MSEQFANMDDFVEFLNDALGSSLRSASLRQCIACDENEIFVNYFTEDGETVEYIIGSKGGEPLSEETIGAVVTMVDGCAELCAFKVGFNASYETEPRPADVKPDLSLVMTGFQ